MKPSVAFFAVAILACVAASSASAQVVVSRRPVVVTPAPVSVGPTTTTIVPYNYYTPLTSPARRYVGYGDDHFAYYGRPYGSPSDRWTWPFMSDAYYARTLAHYYYPPVR